MKLLSKNASLSYPWSPHLAALRIEGRAEHAGTRFRFKDFFQIKAN